jgi:hypothetical protein
MRRDGMRFECSWGCFLREGGGCWPCRIGYESSLDRKISPEHVLARAIDRWGCRYIHPLWYMFHACKMARNAYGRVTNDSCRRRNTMQSVGYIFHATDKLSCFSYVLVLLTGPHQNSRMTAQHISLQGKTVDRHEMLRDTSSANSKHVMTTSAGYIAAG